MNKLLIALSSISLTISIILAFLFFSEKNACNTEQENTNVSENITIAETPKTVSGKYAYIDVQRILLEYVFYNEIAQKLEKKQKRAENELEQKAKKFQEKYELYVKKAQMGSFLSQQSQEQQEMELRKEQENLAILEQELSLQLQNDMKQLNDQATDTIMGFLKNYNQKAQYDFILNSGAILEHGILKDITDEVIKQLNNNYKQNKDNK